MRKFLLCKGYTLIKSEIEFLFCFLNINYKIIDANFYTELKFIERTLTIHEIKYRIECTKLDIYFIIGE